VITNLSDLIIDIDDVPDLDTEIILEGPSPNIYLGSRKRNRSELPTTLALSNALLIWEATKLSAVKDGGS
jgi:hypothetical protein